MPGYIDRKERMMKNAFGIVNLAVLILSGQLGQSDDAEQHGYPGESAGLQKVAPIDRFEVAVFRHHRVSGKWG